MIYYPLHVRRQLAPPDNHSSSIICVFHLSWCFMVFPIVDMPSYPQPTLCVCIMCVSVYLCLCVCACVCVYVCVYVCV